MGLLDLPTEVLQQILKETIPEAFENLVLTCSALHVASGIFLEQHNKLRKRYRNFSYSTRHRVNPPYSAEEKWDPLIEATGIKIASAIDLLQLISNEPLIARYIRRADLKGDASLGNMHWTNPDPDRRTEPLFPRTIGDTAALRNLVLASPYLRHARIDPELWFKGMLFDVAGHADIFLLTLLPNVVSLAPPSHWGKLDLRHRRDQNKADFAAVQKTLWGVLDAIVDRANDPSLPNASMSKLTTVEPFAGTGYNTRFSLSPCVPFMALNSVREFYAGSCVALCDGYTGRAFEPRYRHFGAKLDKVELTGCIVGLDELKHIVARMQASRLKCFRYVHETKWHGCGYDWDSGAFLHILQRHLGSHLEELSIYLLEFYGNAGRTLVDMTGFERLKVLELDIGTLAGERFREDDDGYQIESASSVTPKAQMALPRLVDLAPASIEVVRIFVRGTDDLMIKASWETALRGLFDGFRHRRASKLPNLREISVVLKEGLFNVVGEEMEGQGVTVVESQFPCPAYVGEFWRRFKVEAENGCLDNYL